MRQQFPDEEQCGQSPPSELETPLDQLPMCFEAQEVANCTLGPDGRTFDGISVPCLAVEAILEEVEVTPLADANPEVISEMLRLIMWRGSVPGPVRLRSGPKQWL